MIFHDVFSKFCYPVVCSFNENKHDGDSAMFFFCFFFLLSLWLLGSFFASSVGATRLIVMENAIENTHLLCSSTNLRNFSIEDEH